MNQKWNDDRVEEEARKIKTKSTTLESDEFCLLKDNNLHTNYKSNANQIF